MMNNIEIIINKENRMVDLKKSSIGNDGENLQYNLVFSFLNGFVDGQARLEYQINGEKYFAILEKHEETYTMPINSLLTKVGKILMQIVITQGTSEEEVPIFKSNVFYMFCNSSINAQTQEPDGYVEWLDIANTKLNELDNINIDAVKENGVATITITKKDGTQQSVNLFDAEGAVTNYELLENLPSIGGVELVGDKSLDELNIQEKGNYLTSENDPLFKQSASYGITSQDIKNWNNKSEFSGNYDDLNGNPTIPTKTSELTNNSGFISEIPSEYITEEELNNKKYLTSIPSEYVTETDYATREKAGLIRANLNTNTDVWQDYLYGVVNTYEQYQEKDRTAFVSKGTLDNVLEAKDYQTKLVDGENIKTINGTSLLGSGNITITSGGSGSGADDVPINTIVEYDGEEVPDGWEEVEESGKNIITAYSTQNVEMASGESLAFDNATILGEKFILENGKIKIGSGVSKVKVSGQIWYYANTTTRQWFVLNQNTDISNQMIAYNNNYNVIAFTPKIIDVKEGDEFYFSLHNIEGTGKVIVNNGASPKIMTYITIEEVSNVVTSVVEDGNYNVITNGEAVKVGYQVDGKDVYRRRFSFQKHESDGITACRTYIPNESITIIDWNGFLQSDENHTFKPYYINSSDYLVINVQPGADGYRCYYSTSAKQFEGYNTIMELYYT